MPDDDDTIQEAIRDVFISPNEEDSNAEPANVVDGLFAIARSLGAVAESLDRVAGALDR